MSRPEPPPSRVSRFGIPVYAWGLLGLLVLATGLLLVGRSDQTANPSISNYGPSGLAAWAELLRRDGYRVRIEADPTPRFKRGDVVFAADLRWPAEEFNMGVVVQDPAAVTAKLVQEYVQQSGLAIITTIPHDFETATRAVSKPTELIRASSDETSQVNFQAVGTPDGPRFDWIPADATLVGRSYQTWLMPDVEQPYDSVVKVGGGKCLLIYDGMAMTNRFLDANDNADVLLNLIRSQVPKGSTIVFVEAFIGNIHDEGFIESLGPWAVAARTQALLLALVIIVTLGARFGSPQSDRIKARGSRELVDAVSDVFRRSRKDGFALELLYDDAMERIRIAMKRPIGTKRKDLLDLMPPELREACLNVGEASVSKVKQAQAMKLATDLLTELDRFEKDSRIERRGR